MITDDADEIDQALEEAFTKQEVNEVHQEPEIELPKVWIKIWILPTVSIISFNVSYENLMLHQGRNSLLMIVLILITFYLKVCWYVRRNCMSINLWECYFWQVAEEPPKEEAKKVGVRFAPEPEMEDIQTKTEVRTTHLKITWAA